MITRNSRLENHTLFNEGNLNDVQLSAAIYDDNSSNCFSDFISNAQFVIYPQKIQINENKRLNLFDGINLFNETYNVSVLSFLQLIDTYLNSFECNIKWNVCAINVYMSRENSIQFDTALNNIGKEYSLFLQHLKKFIKIEYYKLSNLESCLFNDLPNFAFTLTKEVQKYANQIGGHGVFFEDDLKFLHFKNIVYKPIQEFPKGKNELLFYEKSFGLIQVKDMQSFRQFIPKYYGIFWNENIAPDIFYLALEDVTECLANPCVADIKLGRISYSPDADPEKIAIEKFKYLYREQIGFLFTGIKVQQLDNEELFIDRFQSLSFDPDTVFTEGIEPFLSGTTQPKELANQFIVELNKLIDWFNQHRLINLYSASLLIAYNHKWTNENNPSPILVKLIDFTHMTWSNEIDSNCIYGLNSLIYYLNKIN